MTWALYAEGTGLHRPPHNYGAPPHVRLTCAFLRCADTQPVPTAHGEVAHMASAATAPPPGNLKRIVAASLVGATIEWYDNCTPTSLPPRRDQCADRARTPAGRLPQPSCTGR